MIEISKCCFKNRPLYVVLLVKEIRSEARYQLATSIVTPGLVLTPSGAHQNYQFSKFKTIAEPLPVVVLSRSDCLISLEQKLQSRDVLNLKEGRRPIFEYPPCSTSLYR